MGKDEIREQLALLVQDTEEEAENEILEEKRPRQEEIETSVVLPALSEPVVTHSNETEAVAELNYDGTNLAVSHFNEALAPEVELHYNNQEMPSSCSPSLTDGWELVDGEGDSRSTSVGFGAKESAPSSLEPSSLP